MQRPRQEPEGTGFVPAGAEESSAVEEIDDGGSPRKRLCIEALPAFAAMGNPTVGPRRYDAEGLPRDLHEEATADASVEALREAVERAAVVGGTVAAAAWHAEPVVRFLCSTFGDGIASVRVNEDRFVVITTEFYGANLVEGIVRLRRRVAE